MTRQLELPFGSDVEEAAPVTPADRAALQRRVHEVTQELLAKARAHWPEARFLFPRIGWTLRGRCAGEACARTNVANYNLPLLERYGEDFVREIVPHEVAHLVVGAVWPTRVKPHGPEWRQVMAFFGARARATHEFETVPARRVARVPYRCACGRDHRLTPRAHRLVRRGLREYVCRSCRQVLVWVEG